MESNINIPRYILQLPGYLKTPVNLSNSRGYGVHEESEPSNNRIERMDVTHEPGSTLMAADSPQTKSARLSRLKEFYNNRPLHRSLDEKEFVLEEFLESLDQQGIDAFLENALYQKLQSETKLEDKQGRSLVQCRQYWDGIRRSLQDEDFEYETWPPDETIQIPEHTELRTPTPSTQKGQASRKLRHLKEEWKAQAEYRQEVKEYFLSKKKKPIRASELSEFAESELMSLQNYFHQGQYQEAIDFDTIGLSADNKLPARVLSLRAQIALGQAEDVIAELKGEKDVELVAVGALAEFAAGHEEKALKIAEELSSKSGENGTVQVLAGTVLQAAGKSEEALALLSKHQGNLEAVALIVQIHLEQNRTDLAIKEVQAARSWAQDSLLVNLAESWVGMRVGGERYQQGFYVFEELAQAPSTSSSKSLVSQAIAEIHLGRLDEAEAALQQALSKDPKNVEAIANSLVLNVIAGKDAKQLTSELQSVAPNHHFLVDLQEKSALFDKAATKYSAKVAA